jgi:hypothetical protein
VQLLASRRQGARVNSTGEHMQILVSVVIVRERKMLGAPFAAGTVGSTFLRHGQTNAAGVKRTPNLLICHFNGTG